MSRVLVIPNCTVEIRLPDMEVESVEFVPRRPRVRLSARHEVENVLFRHNGHTFTIKRLFLESIVGHMLPVPVGGDMVYFTTEDDANPPVIVVEGDRLLQPGQRPRGG